MVSQPVHALGLIAAKPLVVLRSTDAVMATGLGHAVGHFLGAANNRQTVSDGSVELLFGHVVPLFVGTLCNPCPSVLESTINRSLTQRQNEPARVPFYCEAQAIG
jgi:hypothetical protein